MGSATGHTQYLVMGAVFTMSYVKGVTGTHTSNVSTIKMHEKTRTMINAT